VSPVSRSTEKCWSPSITSVAVAPAWNVSVASKLRVCVLSIASVRFLFLWFLSDADAN